MLERRQYPRLRKSYRIVWDHQDVQCAGVTFDICPGGIFIMTDLQLPARTLLDLEIRAEDSTVAVRCRGEVAWVNRGELPMFPPGFGLRFLDLDQEALEWVVHLCSLPSEWDEACAEYLAS